MAATAAPGGVDWFGQITGAVTRRRRAPTNKTAGDYIGAIRRTKAYLDGYWNAGASCFQIASDYPNTTTLTDGTAWRNFVRDTWGNAWWLQTVAILAGYDAAHGTSFASATDKSRAILLANQFAGTTGAVWDTTNHTWFHQMDGVDYRHTSLDSNVAEALYYAYKYRTALGWTVGGGPAAALAILTVDQTTSMYGGHTLTVGTYTGTNADNQDCSYWLFNRMCLAALLGSAPAGLGSCLKLFLDNMDRVGGSGAGITGALMLPDFGWKYVDALSAFSSWEYGAMSLGGALLWQTELGATVALTSAQQDRLKAWGRHILGQWQLNGYPNWDTSFSNARMHSLAYWMHGYRSLIAIARGALNQNSGDAAIAKGILDASVDTFATMDIFRGDPRDGDVIAWPEGVDVFPGYHSGRDETTSFDKWAFGAKFAASLALAVDLGVADTVGTRSKNIFTWQWSSTPVHVSTPNYSAAIIPSAPVIGSNFGGADTSNGSDAVQLQNWGPSHVQTPDNHWPTALGGNGAGHAFVAQVTRNGTTVIDTGASSPTSRDVYCDGVQVNSAKTAYSLTAIPTDFTTSLRHVCSGAETNYSLTADTTFYPDRFETTYTVTKVGTAGTVQLLLEMPCRTGVTMKAHDGSTLTTIWDGTTPATKAAPVYVHQSWGSYGILWLVSSLSGFTASAASKAVSAAAYSREVDRDRSTLLTLSGGTVNTSASVVVKGYVTNGTDQDANHKAGLA